MNAKEQKITESLLDEIAKKIVEHFHRGALRTHLFYRSYPPEQILQTVFGESESRQED